MTIVTYRHGIVAADSRAADTWIYSDEMEKIFRISDDIVVTGTGNYGAIVRFSQWARCSPGVPAPVMKDSRGLLFTHEGHRVRIDVYEEEDYFTLYDNGELFSAWGSGMPPARAALLMGADARRAVEIAIQVDPYCGGMVQYMPVNKGQR